MSYQIEIENLHTCYDLANTQIGEWMPALEGVLQQIQNIQNSDSIEGAAADAMSAYLSEVPTTVIGLLSQAMAEYVSRFLLYLNEYSMLDSAYTALFTETTFDNLANTIPHKRSAYCTEVGNLNKAISSIEDIVALPEWQEDRAYDGFEAILRGVNTLNADVYAQEVKFSSGFDAIDTLLDQAERIIDHYTTGLGLPEGYKPGKVAGLYDQQAASEALRQSGQYLSGSGLSLLNAADNIQHWDRLKDQKDADADKHNIAADRLINGTVQMASGAALLYGSVATIIGSGGTLAPAALVAMQMLTTASYAAYGGSEIVEGLGNVQLGFAGDMQTAASNPTLDLLFNNNRDYYNLWGTASGLASLGLTYAASKFPTPPVQEFVPVKGKNYTDIKSTLNEAMNKKTIDTIHKQSKTSSGPCLSGIYDPKTGKISYGQNFRTNATGKADYYRWLEQDADPVIKEMVTEYSKKITDGSIKLSSKADFRLAGHSELVALDDVMKNRRALGLEVDRNILSELYLQNVDLTKAYKYGEIATKIRCEHCHFLTDGINFF